MPVSEETYERVALEDDETKWELVCGRLVAKPDMTAKHEHVGRKLVRRLNSQLPEDAYDVGQDSPKLRSPAGNYRIPDVCVVPLSLVERQMAERPARLEVYAEPVPLVVEIWSPSTGETDRSEKLREYQQRGDLEIWHIHPYERWLIAWRRQPDGSYTQTRYTGGLVEVSSLPGVVIDLDTLFN
jgi:Uma2 family endonuclease